MKAYRVAGTTDDVTTCELCGKPELTGTVVLIGLDDAGNDDGVNYFGTSCAAKAAGWTVRQVKAGIKSAHDAEREAKAAIRREYDERMNKAFIAWKIEHFGTADDNKIRDIAKNRNTTFARITDGFFQEWNAINAM